MYGWLNTMLYAICLEFFYVADGFGELQCAKSHLKKRKDFTFILKVSGGLRKYLWLLILWLFGPLLHYYFYSMQQFTQVRDTFAMMASQKQLSQPGLPDTLPVRTKKDKTYNDFVVLHSAKHAVEGNTTG